MPLSPGTRLGVYDITAPIGEGGMGQVYRATDTTLGRQVAIKILPDAFASDPERLARFEGEAKTLASLNHPHIAAIYGFEKSSGLHALVMELVEGEDLAQRIARGAIPIDEALPIAKQIADALEAAHEQGIIHRDLKPANIKVRPDGTVKVLDFGLAKAIDPAGASSANAMNSPTLSMHATQAGVILGTAAYMSPEQAAGKAIDKRSDLWAFGVVLLETLTGRQVFAGETVSHVLASVLKDEPDWTTLPATTPPAIGRLLRRCLEKDRKRRLESAADARLDIEEALTTPVPAYGAAERSMAAPRSVWLRALPWAAAVALALALAYVSLALMRQRAQPSAMVRFTVAAPFGVTRPAQTAFALSPDGRTIAFQAIGADGVGRIFTRRLDQTDAQPVPGTDNGTVPFWSPDSRSLGFGKEGSLYRTDLDGTAPRRLCEVPGGDGRNLTSGTWGIRGVIVFASSDAGLSRVPDSGGTPTPVTSFDAANKEVSHASPSFLPDGRRVLFLALAFGQIRGVIWAVSIDNAARTRVAESSGGAAYADGWLLTTSAVARDLIAQPFDPVRLSLAGAPQPVRDRLTIASTNSLPGFSVSLNGALAVDRPPPVVHQLTWMDRDGRGQGTVGPAANISAFALAPDERRVIAAVRDDARKSDLWLFDAQQKGSRLTFQGSEGRPLWALDGRHVYFTSTNFELRSLAIGATEAERFASRGEFVHFEDVTRDGRYLVFKSMYVPLPAVWIQRVGVPDERRALVQGQFPAMQARVSADSRWLAYTLSLPRGPEIFVQPFDRSGDRIQVSRTGGTGAIWRADGRELYFEGPDGLMAVPTAERGGALQVGPPQKLFAIHTQGLVTNQPHNVEVAANGQKFLVNTIVGDSDNVPIEVTLNWTAALKK